MSPVSFEGILSILLIFGAIPTIILVGIIMKLKNRRHKVEEHSKLISQMIEKSEGANIDFKAMAEMLNESDSKKKTTKMAVLKHLEYGALCSLVGLFVLLYGLFINPIDKAVIIGGLLLTIGVAFLIMFFVSKNYLKKEIEKEKKALSEKE